MAVRVSIIIPVYKAGECIGACLESVAAQTLDGVEVVLVDDRGEDGTFEKAEAFAEGCGGKVKFVTVIMPRNAGPAAARNAGLSAASGEYVAFLDADDLISPTFCEKLYTAAKAARADIACCDIVIRRGEVEEVKTNPCVSDGLFTIDLHKKYLRRMVSYFTTYIYRREMLSEYDIRFPDTRSAEDSCFLICAILSSGRIARVREALYVYNLREGSVSGSRNRRRGIWRLRSFKALRRWALSHGMQVYRLQIAAITIRKGWALALRDFITG